MPKVSSKTNSETANNDRVNPYITKSISKTLLTPCRPVGLSRKRKTPSSGDLTADIIKCTSQELKQSNSNTTPVSSKCISIEDSRRRIECESKINDTDDKKKSISKCLIAADKSDDDLLKETALNDQKYGNKSSSSQRKRKKVEEKLDKSSSSINQEQEMNRVKKSEKKSLQITDKLKEAKLPLLKEINNENDDPTKNMSNSEVTSDKSKSSTLEVHSVKIVTPQPTTYEDISQKTKNTNEDISYSTKLSKNTEIIEPMLDHNYFKPEEKKTYCANENISHCAQICDNSKIIEPTLHRNGDKPEKKKNKLKRSLSMKKSSEDYEEKKPPIPTINSSPLKECTIVLNKINMDNVVEKILPDISKEDVKKLERLLREKKKLVEDLTQAEIYKKLHDVSKLNALTATWKTGCIAALNDLLPHLQVQGNINMATVLKNLQIPNQLIQLSDNGNLM